MYLSIIIPAHNEEKRIGRTLEQYLKAFDKNTEFWVILNACHDNTLAVVKEKQNKYSNLRYLDIKEPINKGGAIREGFKAAQGQYIGFVDADMATSPYEYKKLVNNLKDYDGVMASRYAPGAQAKRTLTRRFVSRGFRLISKLLFHLPYFDTQCGAKIYKRELIKKILPEMKINNMMFDIELLVLARKYGFKIKEVPTKWQEIESSALLGSPFKLIKNSLLFFKTLIKLKIRLKNGKKKNI
ncbi:MAG: glycosyltransferase [Patescibacteria group bacterium]|nr:glycosyltransferase [Patescibacteria group bacterium]